MSWEEIKQSWSDGWRYLAQQAQSLYDSITSDPEQYQDDLEKFVAELEATRGNLDAIEARLPKHPKTEEEKAELVAFFELEDRYNELAAGLYSDAVPAEQVRMGIVPILIVAGLAIGVAGTAWGVAAYEYAVNLREETAVMAKELDARIEASKEGRTLQATTLPDMPSANASVPGLGSSSMGRLALLAGVVAAGAGAFVLLRKEK